MALGQEASGTHPDDAASGGPTDSDVESWAAAERRRRQAWLAGPTDEEKAAWARREQERRQGNISRFALPRPPRPTGDASRVMQRYLREMQLATEGAFSLLFRMSVSDAFDALVQAGREWEDEFTTQAPRRRRVPLESDAPGEVTSAQARVPHPPEGTSPSN